MRSLELEGRLARVDWSRLEHAYGPATDLPAQLLRYLSAHAEDRLEADAWVLSALWHQGTVFEATAHAVPFLVLLLGDARVQERGRIATALGLIAEGNAYLDANGGVLAGRGRQPAGAGPEPAELERQRGWVLAARAAVRAGTPVFLEVLDRAGEPLRSALIYLLAHLREEAAAILPLLGELEGDSLARRALTTRHPHPDDGQPCATCLGLWAELAELVKEDPEPPEPRLSRPDAEALAALARGRTPCDPAELLRLAWRCLQSGLPALALALGEDLAATPLATEAPIVTVPALVALDRAEEARRIAVPLARAWLEPATGPSSISQWFQRRAVAAMLEAFADQEAQDLHSRVERAPEPEVWISPGDSF